MVRSADYVVGDDANCIVGDDVVASSSSHCLVYVEGAWRIINQHWGSFHVRREDSKEWKWIDGLKVAKHKGEDKVRLSKQDVTDS